MKALFVCSANMLRSPTAEKLFATYTGVEARSGGTLSAIEGTHEVCDADIDWADIVFFMERHHATAIERRFPLTLAGKQVIVLGIPDDYDRDDPDLIRLLRRKVEPFLEDLDA